MKNALNEPLLHFLLLGLLLFLVYGFLNSGTENREDYRIQISDADIERMVAVHQRNWGTKPDSLTLQKLVAEEVKSEIMYREALRLNLDHNDEIIRRRLRQKYEFLVKDISETREPGEEELRSFYHTNKALFKERKKLSFYQAFFSPDHRNNPLAEALSVWEKVKNTIPKEEDLRKLGDDFHLPVYFGNKDKEAIMQQFGNSFANALFGQFQTGWIEPVESGYGIHLVYISAANEAELLSFEQVKSRVQSAWKDSLLLQHNEQLYRGLLREYELVFDLEKYDKKIAQ